MKMMYQKEYLDLVMVPLGLIIMFAYHLFLLYRCLRLPHTTVIGFENIDKKLWVQKIMQINEMEYWIELTSRSSDANISTLIALNRSETRDMTIALNVLSTNITAATYLASISLTLAALIGAWIANNSNIFQSKLIYGDTRPATMSIKYITLLICFLLAFSCFVQSSRWFIYANYLMSTPECEVLTEYVEVAVIRGGDFWSVGLRALYFATPLLMWFFGPIPMFATSVITVVILHYVDSDTASLSKNRGQANQRFKRLVERV